uniref:AIRC domain-containing protein n=1 Tax=Caenorhabditis tropicalis TaxID=1561998 RepID=A0A1I7V0W6_9PELO
MSSLSKTVSNPENLKLLAEGKTKQIYEIDGEKDYVLIRSKDSLTAFNAERKNELEGKSRIASQTTVNVFEYLRLLGLPTHFEESINETDFIARKCTMIPIEWVARRVATGSFLKRNPGVKEGFRFNDLKLETFYKDDANDDPQWTDEQIISNSLRIDHLKIGKEEISLMKKMTKLVFRALEKSWALENSALIDMKIEFGVTVEGEILLADVIDNDSWRVWPENDRRLQLDKQVYRDMKEVTAEGLQLVLRNYTKVMEITSGFSKPRKPCHVLVIMGSGSDGVFARKIADAAQSYGLETTLKVSSAHKTTSDTLEVISEFEESEVPTVIIAVAGRSNGLGPVIAGNSSLPVINCPPPSESMSLDIWSSLRMPNGIGCTTVLDPSEAALAAAKILASHNHIVFGKVLTAQLKNQILIYNANRKLE